MPRKALKILAVNGTVEEHDSESTMPSTTIANQLSDHNAWKHLAVLKWFSKSRMVEMTAEKFDKDGKLRVKLRDYSVCFEKLQFWDSSSGGRHHSSMPLICLHEADGVVIVNGWPVDILKSLPVVSAF